MKLQIFSRPIETEIHFSAALETLPSCLKGKIALITDDTIHDLYGALLQKLDAQIFSFPSGEKQKNRHTKQLLEDQLFSHQYGKDTYIVAIGGGIVMDIAGFVASTFCRGVPLILIPTTLLGMVDACLGGKTGVNTEYGKNLIGSFYFPKHIIIDENFLKTLPKKQLLNGMAEILKYGCIHSKELLIQTQTKSSLLPIIKECLKIKKEIIEADPFEEKGLRRILNFGHTIGHALETLENYQIEHGEAISIGMIVEGYLSQRLGIFSRQEFDTLSTLFADFPLTLNRPYEFEEMMRLLSKDKKGLQNQARFVLLKSLGQVESFDGEYCTHIEPSLLKETVEWMNREFACK